MYNCYYHPKTEGSTVCKGCKLPVCGGCEGDEGFCPECVRKRAAVHQLKELRGAIEKRQKLASTTARLRLAIKQVGVVRPATPSQAASKTRPLTPSPSAPASIAPARKPARRRATGPIWKYEPEKIAYRAPEALKSLRQAKAGRQKAARPVYVEVEPFQLSLMVVAKAVSLGVALLIGFLVYQLFFRVAPKPVYHPLFTTMTPAQSRIVARTIAEAAPERRRYVDLPDVSSQEAPKPSQVLAVSQPVKSKPVVKAVQQKAAEPAVTTPVRALPVAKTAPAAKVMPKQVDAPRPVVVAVVEPRRAPHVVVSRPEVPHVVSVTRPHRSLADAIKFSDTREASVHNAAKVRQSKVEVIHW